MTVLTMCACAGHKFVGYTQEDNGAELGLELKCYEQITE
jgi:hypothetical protein